MLRAIIPSRGTTFALFYIINIRPTLTSRRRCVQIERESSCLNLVVHLYCRWLYGYLPCLQFWSNLNINLPWGWYSVPFFPCSLKVRLVLYCCVFCAMDVIVARCLNFVVMYLLMLMHSISIKFLQMSSRSLYMRFVGCPVIFQTNMWRLLKK